jgi:hypothetical protein
MGFNQAPLLVNCPNPSNYFSVAMKVPTHRFSHCHAPELPFSIEHRFAVIVFHGPNIVSDELSFHECGKG